MTAVTSGTKFLFFDAAAQATDELLHVLGIFWVSYTGAGLDIASQDVFLLTDGNSKTILGKKAEAAGDGLEIVYGFPGLPVQGLTVTTMGGGVCWVHCTRDIKA